MWGTGLFCCLVVRHTTYSSVVRIGAAVLSFGAWGRLAAIAGVALLARISRVSRIALFTRSSGVAFVPGVASLTCVPRLSGLACVPLLSGLALRALLSGRSGLSLRCRCWCCLRWRCLATGAEQHERE
jgi:hypothetical protein